MQITQGLFLIIGLLVTSTSFSQERDTFQPDSIYRINKVKTRIRFSEKAETKSKLVYNYDRQGRWIEFILTDNFVDDKIQMKVVYQYDNSGKLIGETETAYSGDNAEVTETKIEYDEKRRVTRKKKSSDGQIVSEETYTYNPSVEVEKIYRYGKVYRQQTTYYEYPNYSSRFTGTELADKNSKPKKIKLSNGKVVKFNPSQEGHKWDYKFENTVDNKGRLILRRRLLDGVVQDETTYTYNDKGLLIETLEKGTLSKNGRKELFEYKYWE